MHSNLWELEQQLHIGIADNIGKGSIMKKVSLVGKIRYLGSVFIVMQGILFALLTIFSLNSRYQEQWGIYPENANALIVYLNNISSGENNEVEQFLYETSDDQKLFVVRRDLTLDNNGVFDGYMFGVYGDTDNNEISFDFLGKQVISNKELHSLIYSNNQESTIGISQGTINSMKTIPAFRFGENTVFKKMQQLVEESETINGTYIILGLQNEGEKEIFTNSLAIVSNISPSNLVNKKSGKTIDDDLKETIIIGFIIAQFILNIVFFLVLTIRNLSKGGKLFLLGWSRISFCWEILGPFFMYTLINIPIQIIIGLIFCGWNEFSMTIISSFVMYALVNVFLIIIELGVSVVVILTISPINAIHGRIHKKALYIFGIFAYVGISVGIMICGSYVDVPIKTMTENMKLSERWERVSEYHILENISVGQDEKSFTGQSIELNQNIYDWYKAISEKEGVFLINTTYYNNVILENWKKNKLYEETPEKPFWYFTLSPNYIKKIGIEVDDSLLTKALNGTRIYLLPNTLSDDEKNNIIAWLKESAVSGIREGDIDTLFNENREIEFVTYMPSKELFTWATDKNETLETISPIIYICTPENMRYFESESLRANGLDGYIKFMNEEIKTLCTEDTFMNSYNLSDNEVVFSKVQNYIDGLQKNLKTTILWFGLVFIILGLILIGILLALASVFRIVNYEKINVKKFLGYGFINIYKGPIIMLNGMVSMEVLIMILFKSRFGLGLIIIIAVIQGVIFQRYMIRNEIREILRTFKEA